MKQSFFLVIPKQHSNPQRLKEYEAKIVTQWISELPIANPILAIRLIFDYLVELNSIKMSAQLRLDTIEMLIPSLFTVEEFLRSNLLKSGFPKDENDKKTLGLLVALEKQFTLSYWIIAKELTQNEISWFQGKNAVLAIVRCIKGLSAIVASHFMMGMPVPSWIWMDLHALYKLSIKLKKHTTQVALNETSNKSVSPEEAYLQILLLSLADPTGLMQKEINSVYQFVDKLTQLVSLKTAPIAEQTVQCLVLVDEDMAPFFQKDEQEQESDSAKLYVDLTRLCRALGTYQSAVADNACSRFNNSNTGISTNVENFPKELLHYLSQRWAGKTMQSAALFNDRLDRFIAIGLSATYKLQKAIAIGSEEVLEYSAYSISNRMLSCDLKQSGLLSIGSLVSFRRIDMPEHKRFLGIIDMLVVEKEENKISFGVHVLTHQSIAVSYSPISASKNELPKPALFYKTIEEDGASYIISDNFVLKEGDLVRLSINQDDFPIVLKNKINIGLGYWQFECLRVTEKRK